MRSDATILLLLTVVATLALPMAAAAPTLAVTETQITTDDGQELRVIPQNEFVKVRVVLNNTGASEVNETVTLHLTIESKDLTYRFTRNVTTSMRLKPGNTTVVVVNWPPTGRQLGNHTLTIDVLNAPNGHAVRSFTVAKTGVVAGDLGDRILNYYWFFGAFVLAVVLFFIVLGARKS